MSIIRWLIGKPSLRQVARERLERARRPTEDVKALFVGGPMDGEIVPVDPELDTYHCETSSYRKEYLGFENHEFVIVFVWDLLLINEAIDLVVLAYSMSGGDENS